MIDLISVWLKNRYFYVGLDIGSSIVHCSEVGTVQGSILGPILYAIFVSPLIDLAMMTLFADDNYGIHKNKQILELLIDMKRSIEIIIKWLGHSGLKVNEGKTEMCLFLRNDYAPITLTINGSKIKSTPSIKVLGVDFDSKFNWHKHIAMAISKSRKALQAIKLTKKHISKKELITLVTSKYYSILFYNFSIWLIPGLTRQSKLAILSASAAPLKFCCAQFHKLMSYERLHEITGRPPPNAICKYNHALILHKT